MLYHCSKMTVTAEFQSSFFSERSEITAGISGIVPSPLSTSEFFCSQNCNINVGRLEDVPPPQVFSCHNFQLCLFKLHGKMDFADGIKVTDLKIGKSARCAQCNQIKTEGSNIHRMTEVAGESQGLRGT